jgi:bifunctional UDP-N-acetylglucosamine pyrophosphorylase/glucosamine-1-phosphate N-acetyltransferase
VSDDAIVILAAGKGTRMRSPLPKLLHVLAGKTIIERVFDAVTPLQAPVVVVVGHEADSIRERLGDRWTLAVQPAPLGTGDAVRVGLEALPDNIDRVLVVHGDEPLIEAETYRRMLDLQAESSARIVLLTATVRDTREFGRVVRNWRDQPTALVQQSDLTEDQLGLNEVNLGAYVFDAEFLRSHLPRLEPHQPKSELYLTDLVEFAASDPSSASGDGPIASVTLEDGDEFMGVNDLVHLEQASRTIYGRTNHRLMELGVTIVDSGSTFIDESASVLPGTVIYPFTIIEGATRIGGNCRIGPYTHVESSRIGNRCVVRASTIEGAEVESDVSIGPYAHLRRGAQIGSGSEIGNFAEIKEASLGQGTRMHHFGYVGDAEVGKDVNIGAGAVTCNYDGVSKHRTVVGDGAFIGSDTMLRAPVTVGRGAFTGAGSVVTHDVPDGSVVTGVPARVVREAGGEEREDGPSGGGG